MNVGFIGLGQMGVGMAGNLLKAGHAVAVYNRTPSKAQPLVAQGAKAASSIVDACRGDVVITMLSNDEAVNEVVFGPAGVVASLPKGAIHMSSSTISVALSERLTTAHRAAAQRFVAAPVLGRPEAAVAAKLFVVAAGERDAIEALTPVTGAIGQRTFTVGDTPSAANLVKLSANFLIASVIESLSEAMALIAKGGVDQRAFLDLLTSTVFTAPVYKTYGQLIVDQRFEPAGFSASLGIKDVRLALAAADSLNVPMPIASLVRDRFLALLAGGGADLDWTAIAQLASRDAGAIDG
jgi:3-hydroxyisobutyrate dehydrogenase-like beta-hydroxyacid dehydrogenase